MLGGDAALYREEARHPGQVREGGAGTGAPHQTRAAASTSQTSTDRDTALILPGLIPGLHIALQ